jgi:hypothetical protein
MLGLRWNENRDPSLEPELDRKSVSILSAGKSIFQPSPAAALILRR